MGGNRQHNLFRTNKEREYSLMKNRLRLAVFGHKRIPSREGGVEIVAEELAVRMVNRGYQVTCINRKGHHISGVEYDGQKLDSYKGIKIEAVPTVEIKGIAAASSSFFATLKVAFGKYDIVHIHAEGPAFFCWILKLTGKRVICQCHGLDHERPRWRNNFGGWYIKHAEKEMVKHADEIIVLSKNVQYYFKDVYGRKTVYIPNGVKCPELKEASLIKEKWKLKKDSYILLLSRLTEEKGVHYLIEAYKNLETDKKLVIAGGSSDSMEYVHRIRAMASGNSDIIFTGFVQGQLLEELYSNAYIYVIPSELEGMPLTLLEAMSYGNCCLTSDIPECTEIVGDRALHFENGNVVDLVDKLQKLLDTPMLVNYYKGSATNYICGKYDWEKAADKVSELYNGTRIKEI